MELAQKEFYIARICSGSIRCTIRNHRFEKVTLIIKRPSRDQIYQSCEIQEQAFEDAQENGLYSEEQLLVFMIEQEMWDDERQSLLDKLPKEIDEFKVQLYKAKFKSNERAVVRKALGVAKEKFSEISHNRYSHNHLSCSGASNIAKARYLLGCSLHHPSGVPVFNADDFWDQPSVLLDNVMTFYHSNRIEEAFYREIVRTDPWRCMWSTRVLEGSVFGGSVCDYTDEQRTLINWSNLYDNVGQHPECPNDSVLNDDDVFDGWLIEQRRKRESKQGQTGDDGIHDEKIRNSQEVYLVAETIEDARKVVDMNDAHGRATQKMRFDFLTKKGVPVNELEMPDTKQRLRMEAVQALSQRLSPK